MPVNRSLTTKLLLLYNIVLFAAGALLFAVIVSLQSPGSIAEDLYVPVRAFIASAFGRPVCPDCNVILVSLDTLGANHLPCYGYARNTAPQLCSYARENLLFTRTYSNATYTLPSHVSIFTGLLPSKHGVNEMNRDSLDPGAPFLPEILQRSNYKTYFAMSESNHLPVDKVYNRGIDNITFAYDVPDWEKGLRRFADNVAKGGKTFLFLHTYYTHAPYIPADSSILYAKDDYANIPRTWKAFAACTKEYAEFFKQNLDYDIATGYWGDKTALYKTYADEIHKRNDDTAFACKVSEKIGQYRGRYYWSKIDVGDPGQVAELRDLYDQRINELDQKLVYLINFVKNQKYKNNTVVIFTSDHGEEFLEHGSVEHNTLYDSNTHVLLTMHIPGIRGKTVSSLAQSIDIVPTLLDVLGISHKGTFQGESLVPSFSGFRFSQTEKYVITQSVPSKRQTIRTANNKLFLETRNGIPVPYELYDLTKDPNETKNIIYTNPAAAEQLKKQLQSAL